MENENQPDPILDILSDTEVDTTSENVETPEPVEANEVETLAEGEQEPEAEEPEDETDQPQEPEFDAKEEARRRYAERQQLIAERRQAFQAKAEEAAQKHISEADDEYDQRVRQVEANDTRREYERYVENIERTEATLVSEFDRVKASNDLQIFNPDSAEFDQKAYNYAIRNYYDGKIIKDQNNNITGLKGSLYEHFKETADLIKGAVKTGQFQQVRATQKMRSTADAKPAAQPKEQVKDTILDILNAD